MKDGPIIENIFITEDSPIDPDTFLDASPAPSKGPWIVLIIFLIMVAATALRIWLMER